MGCRQYDRKCSFYFNYDFFHTTLINQDLRQKAVYFPARPLCGVVPRETVVSNTSLLALMKAELQRSQAVPAGVRTKPILWLIQDQVDDNP